MKMETDYRGMASKKMRIGNEKKANLCLSYVLDMALFAIDTVSDATDTVNDLNITFNLII